jgi:hypothetical protein
VNRASVALRPHDSVRVTAVASAAASEPFNLATDEGDYRRVWIVDGDVWFARSQFTTPPFDLVRQVTFTGQESNPKLAYDLAGRLWLLYTHTEGDATWVYETTSGDDGESWEPAVILIPGGKHPHPVVDLDGIQFASAYVEGTIQAREKQAGLWGLIFTFLDGRTGLPLRVKDDKFGITILTEGGERAELAVILEGGADVEEWVAGSDLRDWEPT